MKLQWSFLEQASEVQGMKRLVKGFQVCALFLVCLQFYSSVHMMILAQIKPPFVCHQEAILTTSFLDTAAGDKRVFLSYALRQMFLDKVDYIQILRNNFQE